MLSKFAAAVLFVTITVVVAPYFSAAVFVGMLCGLLHFSVASVVALVCVAFLCLYVWRCLFVDPHFPDKSFLAKMFYVVMVTSVARTKYYFAWRLGAYVYMCRIAVTIVCASVVCKVCHV